MIDSVESSVKLLSDNFESRTSKKKSKKSGFDAFTSYGAENSRRHRIWFDAFVVRTKSVAKCGTILKAGQNLMASESYAMASRNRVQSLSRRFRFEASNAKLMPVAVSRIVEGSGTAKTANA